MNDSDTASNDFEYARRVKHDLLVKGSEALDDMMEVARSTEHPRAYEVLSNMMKNVGEVTDSLLDLHKKLLHETDLDEALNDLEEKMDEKSFENFLRIKTESLNKD